MAKHLFIAFLLVWLTNNIRAQNLIKNGQFNDGVKGWTVLLDEKAQSPIKAHVIKSNSNKQYGLADTYTKTNFVELDAHSIIKQTVKTKEGETYTLVFGYAHRPNAGDKQLIIAVNGKPIYTKKIANAQDAAKFQYKDLTYIAKTKQTTLEFFAVSLGGDDNMGVLITDIVFNKQEAVDLDAFKY